jgi:hypothetical protein
MGQGLGKGEKRVLPPVTPFGFSCEDWLAGEEGPPTGVTRSLPLMEDVADEDRG